MDKDLAHHLKNWVTLLTPTRRLATELKKEMGYLQSHERSVWPTPCIFAWEDWLQALWEQYEIEGLIEDYLLTSTQSLLRWEELIQHSSIGKTLLRPLTTAKMAFEAWSLLHQWRALDLLQEKSHQVDQAAFQDWAKHYQSWLTENKFCDKAQLPQKLLTLLLSSNRAWQRVSPKSEIILYGFEELSPFQNDFFSQLAQQEWRVEFRAAALCVPDSLKSVMFEGSPQEWKAAALWAKTCLQAGKKQIAIVSPEVVEKRKDIEAIFNEVMTPLLACQPYQQVNRLVNISAAIPLTQYPVVQAALQFLKLSTIWSLPDYIALVNSPFFQAGESEFFLRARYLKILKKQTLAHYSLIQAIHFLGSLAEDQKPVLWEKGLHQFNHYLASLPALQSWYHWGEHFKKLVGLISWPGERILNSIEFQTVSRFYALLESFAQYDHTMPPADLSQALSILLKLAHHTPFQPENKKAPIQVLGMLEAAGQQFDHLWVLGLHNEAWPPPAIPNPFISVEKQRVLNMPHASAQRQAHYAFKMTQNLKQSAKELIFSYAYQDKTKQLDISELIRDLPKGVFPFEETTGIERSFPPSTLAKNNDDKAPPVTPSEDFVATSGTLTLQAACPFKAFAQERLKLQETPSSEIWLQPYQRGIILHNLLEKLWGRYKTQSALKALSEAEREQQIDNLIKTQLNKMLSKQAPTYYYKTEQMRLRLILKDYLTQEWERRPFKIIALEERKQFNLEEITFKLRCDRIDEDDQGHIILIDYKTGQVKLSDLWGIRPKAPQMGLYYLAWQERAPAALVMHKIAIQGCEWVGVSKETVDLANVVSLDKVREKDLPIEWSALNSYWTERLSALTKAFREGDARVDPLEGPLTCQYCHLGAVCRIREKQ